MSLFPPSNLIANTTTKKGLSIRCDLDRNTYPKGIKVSDAEMASLSITCDAFHPEWNYKISPRNPNKAGPAGDPAQTLGARRIHGVSRAFAQGRMGRLFKSTTMKMRLYAYILIQHAFGMRRRFGERICETRLPESQQALGLRGVPLKNETKALRVAAHGRHLRDGAA
jgi:hypothetical protein